MDKGVLQTEANPAAHQDHFVDMPASNPVPDGHITTELKDDTNINNPSSVSLGDDVHSSSIETPQVNRLRKSTINRAMTNCVAKDKRRGCGHRKIYTRS